MKIIIDKAIPFISDRFPKGTDLLFLPGQEITADIVKDADALIVRTRTICDSNLLEGSKVRLVATATIGTDHIDIPWCESHGIKVESAPGCNAPGVAQYVLSALFASGFDPLSHKLGIVGYGNVGSIVADWARQLGINILVCDPPRKNAGLKDIDYQSLEGVLKSSDAVTLHVPFIKDGEYPTYHIIGERELELMKPGAILVNSSRGGVVDEEALKKELRNGRLKAVIDTWENEPNIDPQLVKLVEIATPHIAGYSAQGKMRGTRMALEAVARTLGIDVKISDLVCIIPENIEISRQIIEKSYNPLKDSMNLKNNYTEFEALRNNYNFRHEPLYSEAK